MSGSTLPYAADSKIVDLQARTWFHPMSESIGREVLDKAADIWRRLAHHCGRFVVSFSGHELYECG